MADELRVDPASVRANSTKLTTAADRVEQARRDLENRLAAIGQCWGNSDEVAQGFAASYVPGRDTLLDGARTVGSAVGGLGEQARGVASYLDDVDSDNARIAGH